MSVPSLACDVVVGSRHPAPDAGGPCATCAFRLGTEANRSAHTVELARLSVEGFREFHCHEKPQICRGYIAAINLRGVPRDEQDRQWSVVAGDAADLLQRCIEGARDADAVARTEGLCPVMTTNQGHFGHRHLFLGSPD